MDVIQMTRELGKAIQQDDRYTAYMLAKQANDNDAELQADIDKFDKLRAELNEVMSTKNPDSDRLVALDTEIKEVYQKVMGSRKMIVFTAAQKALEDLINNVNQIITMCANGEDPDTCQPSSGCSGSCATCSGCH
ncbi:MAG: YlbF family regulator [Ruminococcus sp.]|nr:YlbF family regulator [Ruminococcus sp.]MBQ7027199.1 YlbF family regulator [Ruminococcus sp.]